MRSAGWFRLWVIVSALLIVGVVIYSLSKPDERDGVGSSWYCVPKTYVERVEEIEVGYSKPTDAEIEREIRRVRGDDDKVIRELRESAAALEKATADIEGLPEPPSTANKPEHSISELAEKHSAEARLADPITRDQLYFSCTTYGGLLRSLLVALLLSFALVVVFIVTNWVVRGFKSRK